MPKDPSDWVTSSVVPPLTLCSKFPDRVRGECDWREHLPTVDREKLATLNRGGKNRINHLLVLAFREIDKGRSDKQGRLTWPDGWKNGAGQTIKRRADYWKELWDHAIEGAKALRESSHPKPKRAANIRRDPIWKGRPQDLARRIVGSLLPTKAPRRMGREQWLNALCYLAMAYKLDTGHKPTLTSKDWQSEPTPNSFDTYLELFCKLANLPPSSMRKLFQNYRTTFQNLSPP